MFLAIDRVAKLTYVEFHECAGKMEGAAFLEGLPLSDPHQTHRQTAWLLPTCPRTGMVLADASSVRISSTMSASQTISSIG